MRRLGAIPVALMVQWIFTASSPCIAEIEGDLVAIREVLLTLERGYEERDIETYMSVFSDEEYEYVSDMTTPDDPSDDIYLTETESERRSATRVFRAYENFDLEMTDPEVTINGDSAKAKNEFRIVFATFERPNIPSIYYAGGTNILSLKKINGKWKVVHWQQHEMTAEKLVARMKEERKHKGVQNLIRDLGDDRLIIWAMAMSDLRKLHRTAIDPLIEVLHSEDKALRIRAAGVLSSTQDEGAVRALIQILEDEDDDVDVRVAAASALSGCDGQMVDRSLSKVAKGTEPELKSAASLALARRIRERMDDIYRIAVAGLQHGDEAVREAAAESLGIIMSTRGIDMLQQRLKDRSESENVRLAALKSLKQLRLSEPVLSLFRDALKDEGEAEQIRIHAARALAEAKDHQALESLVDVAESKKETFELRKEAIAALGAMGDSKAAKPLIELLNSSDADLRSEAAKSLELLGDGRALRPLMMVLMNRDENIYVRRLAGRGIVKIDRGIAFGPLAEIVNDETESALARRMAAEMIASLKDERSIPLFAELLKDKRQTWWLRRIAADCLGKMHQCANPTSSCFEALKAAMLDSDERIAKTARDALQRIEINRPANP